MRILLIHNYYQYRGGEDVYFDSLTKLLKDKGHDVYTYTKDSSTIKSFKGKLNTAVGMFCNSKVEKELTDIIQRFKPEIAHFNNIYPLITPKAYYTCKQLGIPIVQTIHTYRFICPKGSLYREGKICELCVNRNFFYPAIKYGCYHDSKIASLFFASSFFHHGQKEQLNLIDRFIFPAEFTRGYYITHLPMPLEKTAVIPHFVEPVKIKFPNDIKRYNYFLFVGRLSEEKGVAQLIRVFSELPKLKLIVIGNGPLRNLLSRQNKFKNIAFKGYLPKEEMLGYMKRALFTIIPSLLYEQGPLVLIESYACSTPVVTPKFASFNKTVKDKKTGIFYKYDDYEDLKEKLIEIKKNRYDIDKMRKFARKEFKRCYTPDKHHQLLLQTYKSMIP